MSADHNQLSTCLCLQAGGIQGAKLGRQLSGQVRRAWTVDCGQAAFVHLSDCLQMGEAPDLQYLAQVTERSAGAVRSRIKARDALDLLYEKCKKKAATTAAAASSAAGVAGAGAVCSSCHQYKEEGNDLC